MPSPIRRSYGVSRGKSRKLSTSGPLQPLEATLESPGPGYREAAGQRDKAAASSSIRTGFEM